MFKVFLYNWKIASLLRAGQFVTTVQINARENCQFDSQGKSFIALTFIRLPTEIKISPLHFFQCFVLCEIWKSENLGRKKISSSFWSLVQFELNFSLFLPRCGSVIVDLALNFSSTVRESKVLSILRDAANNGTLGDLRPTLGP